MARPPNFLGLRMTQSTWRLIRSGALTGAMNMALDEALLEAVADGTSLPVLRLYRWNPPAVSLGYFQRGEGVVNLRACRELGYDIVRRITGGRAVLHHREATYAIISPEKSTLFPGGILENYRVISGVLLEALRSLGVDGALTPARARKGKEAGAQGSACFTAPSNYELSVRGCKITGSAQKRQDDAFLQHGSIPVDLDPERLFQALDTRELHSPEEGGRLLERKVGWLNRWLSQHVSVAQVEESLIAAFSAETNIRFLEDGPTLGELRRAEALVEEKYGNPRWVMKGIEPEISGEEFSQ
jgi:lipoate-protein ligase A